jgi:hypothetical protein
LLVLKENLTISQGDGTMATTRATARNHQRTKILDRNSQWPKYKHNKRYSCIHDKSYITISLDETVIDARKN